MTILFPYCVEIPPKGGGQVYAYETARYMLDHGEECHFVDASIRGRWDYIRPKNREVTSYERDGLRFHALRDRPFAALAGYVFGRFMSRHLGALRWLELQSAPPGYPELGQLLDSVKPDILHTLSFPQAYNYDALSAAKGRGIPLVCTPFLHYKMIGCGDHYHDIQRNPYLHRVLRESDCVMASTGPEKAFLIELGVLPERIEVIPMGVHPDRYDGSGKRFRKAYGIGDRPLILDITTRKCDGKGSIHTLQAIERIQKRMPEVAFASIGATSREWKRAIQDSTARVLDIGYIDEEMKCSAFAAADILMHPSRNDAFGIVILEAWAAGAAVIAADIPAMRDFMEHGEDAILVPVADIAAMEAAALDLLTHKNACQRMAEAGRRKVTRYEWSQTGRRIRDVYEMLIAQSQSATLPHR